ncbi:type III secretion protein [Proteus penneri]|uniref:type III secretion protein n=1 Tax=Proteus penneri TaxID=102862 RepID=UPI001C5E9655|nr:type III secretion protein [Proteus penneri]MCO8051684.1 type III secretion protein [Proteus penneri]
MAFNVSNQLNNIPVIKEQLENIFDDNVKENTKINNFIFDSRGRSKEINERIEREKNQVNTVIPELKKPKIEKPDLQCLIIELDKGKQLKENNIINNNIFNFISKEMINIINLMIDYLLFMIKKYDSSRKLGNFFIKMQLDFANKIKDDLYEKADFILSAAISSAAVSMVIHGIGAFTSIKGMGELKSPNETTNKTMIKGSFISAAADPTSKIVDNTVQNNALRIDGNIKTLESAGHAIGQIDNNNSEIQREASDIIKALIQAIEAIIRANQDAASTISSNVRG